MGWTLPRLVIAALRGGGGKTTLSLGMAAAWRKQGREVVPFKKGPDYIDSAWLSLAAGRPCRNLDTYLQDREKVRVSFFRNALEGEVSLIEGNRGLYDGVDAAIDFVNDRDRPLALYWFGSDEKSRDRFARGRILARRPEYAGAD
jgi:cobyrinic acid a,c-diamide synthase